MLDEQREQTEQGKIYEHLLCARRACSYRSYARCKLAPLEQEINQVKSGYCDIEQCNCSAVMATRGVTIPRT